MSEAQRADYRKLMRSYLDTFRILGKSKLCGLNFNAEPFFREVAYRHGEESEPARFARLSYTASALMRDMRLPELPPSLVEK